MTACRARRWTLVALLLLAVAVLAVAGPVSDGAATASDATQDGAVRLSHVSAGLAGTLLPARLHSDSGSRLDRSPQRTGNDAALVGLSGLLAALALAVGRRARQHPRPPSPRRRAQGAVLSAPPVLLLTP